MVIEAREDVVNLHGNLEKNMWLAIQAAANLLLRQHPTGIIIDCGDLESASGAGVQTFVDALNYIQKQGARMLLVDVPEEIIKELRAVPGAGSQLPIAKTVEEARRSLELQGMRAPAEKAPKPVRPARVVLVPIVAALDWEHGITLACRLAEGAHPTIHLAYILEVPLSQPLGAAVPEAEQAAKEALKHGEALAHEYGVTTIPHVERTREVSDGILRAIEELGADVLVAGLPPAQDSKAPQQRERVLNALLQKAGCELVLDRVPPRR